MQSKEGFSEEVSSKPKWWVCWSLVWVDLGVSKNRGTPKWMVYNGKPLLKWMIWGENPPFKETPIWVWQRGLDGVELWTAGEDKTTYAKHWLVGRRTFNKDNPLWQFLT